MTSHKEEKGVSKNMTRYKSYLTMAGGNLATYNIKLENSRKF